MLPLDLVNPTEEYIDVVAKIPNVRITCNKPLHELRYSERYSSVSFDMVDHGAITIIGVPDPTVPTVTFKARYWVQIVADYSIYCNNELKSQYTGRIFTGYGSKYRGDYDEVYYYQYCYGLFLLVFLSERGGGVFDVIEKKKRYVTDFALIRHVEFTQASSGILVDVCFEVERGHHRVKTIEYEYCAKDESTNCVGPFSVDFWIGSQPNHGMCNVRPHFSIVSYRSSLDDVI